MCKITHNQQITKFRDDNNNYLTSHESGVHLLDTLELTSDFLDLAIDLPGTDFKNLTNRARSKYFTDSYINPLINLDSPLQGQYLKTLECARPLMMKGSQFFSCYCKKRFCIVCARISTAKRIKTYISSIKDFEEPHFMTLTAPSVPGEQLRERIKELVKEFQRIKDNLRKNYKIRLKGSRNIEVTYNPEKDWYHPHIHCIIEGKFQAEEFVNLWLKQFPEASRKAQDIRPFGQKETDLIEAFKYSQKIISKDKKIHVVSMDLINQATIGGKDGVRLFQTFGFKKPETVDLLPEEITGIKETDDFTQECTKLFLYDYTVSDWIEKHTGKRLTGFKPSKALQSFRGENLIIPGNQAPKDQDNTSTGNQDILKIRPRLETINFEVIDRPQEAKEETKRHSQGDKPKRVQKWLKTLKNSLRRKKALKPKKGHRRKRKLGMYHSTTIPE